MTKISRGLTELVCFKITPETRAQLFILAEAEDIAMSTYVRKLLKDKIKEVEKKKEK